MTRELIVRKGIVTLCTLHVALFLCGCRPQALHTDTRVLMGTFVEIIATDERASGIAFTEIKRIEGMLSKYDPASEIFRLNQAGTLTVSNETYYILKKSKEFWEISDGAFDVTVGPLLDIWGFSQKAYRTPTDIEIGDALKKIGMDKVFFDDTAQAVTLAVPGMRLDLGAIAKGYAIDCAVKKLRASGIKNCLINAGGQVYALGYKFSKPWIVGIKHPRRPGIARTITLTDESASTSADYEQYFTKGAVRFAHIFNPRTGYPAQTGLASVTAVAPEGATADALSTAIFVLGRKRGEALAKKIPRVRIYCF